MPNYAKLSIVTGKGIERKKSEFNVKNFSFLTFEESMKEILNKISECLSHDTTHVVIKIQETNYVALDNMKLEFPENDKTAEKTDKSNKKGKSKNA